MFIKVRAFRLEKQDLHYCQIENGEIEMLIINTANVISGWCDILDEGEMGLPNVGMSNGDHWQLEMDWYDFEGFFEPFSYI